MGTLIIRSVSADEPDEPLIFWKIVKYKDICDEVNAALELIADDPKWSLHFEWFPRNYREKKR